MLFCFATLQSLEEAGVDGALIVQPINHKFDHSLVTRFVEVVCIQCLQLINPDVIYCICT